MATKKEETAKQAQTIDSQEIEELIKALDTDLNNIDAESALNLVEQWYSVLHKSKEPEFKDLASELKDLQKTLKSGKATGHEISEILINIGEQTTEFSNDAEKGLKQPLQRLGKQLRKVGTSITKAEDQEYHQQLDALIEKVESEELTSLDSEAGIAAVEFWYDLLHKAEGEQFKQVANSLKELKQALKRGNAKPETIAKALQKVGEQTVEIASEAPRGFKGAIQKLGKQLVKTGESLTSAE